jgi:hypothetical protein
LEVESSPNVLKSHPMNSYLGVALVAFASASAMAQTATNFNATFALGPTTNNERFQRTYTGTGSVGSLGSALVLLNLTQSPGTDYNPGTVPLNVGVGP